MKPIADLYDMNSRQVIIHGARSPLAAGAKCDPARPVLPREKKILPESAERL